MMKHNFSKRGSSKQLSLLKAEVRFFGGQTLHGQRRAQRPLSTRQPIHLVMRSSWAMGPNSFLREGNRSFIDTLISMLAWKYGVRIYQRSVNSNHVHLVVKIECRRTYGAFVRVLSGKIASHVMGGKSFEEFLGNACRENEIQGLGQRFWQFRPFTRVLDWGRDFRRCCEYVVQNTLEAVGLKPFVLRRKMIVRGNRVYLRKRETSC